MDYVAWFDFADGSGWRGPYPLRAAIDTTRFSSESWKRATSSFRITMRPDSTWLSLRVAARTTYAQIYADGVKVFAGRLAATDALEDRGAALGDFPDIMDYELEVLDRSDQLERKITAADVIAWKDAPVCDPDEPTLSIFHRLLELAEATGFVATATCLTILHAYSLEEGVTVGEALDELWQHGLVLRWVVDHWETAHWLIENPVSSMDFDENLILASLKSDRVELEADAVEVAWHSLKDKANCLLYMADLPFGEDNQRSGYPIQPGFLWPEEANPAAGGSGIVEAWWPYDDKALASTVDAAGTKIRKNVDFTQLILTENHRLEAQVDSGIVQELAPVFQNKRARVAWRNPMAGPLNIWYATIFGDTVYRAAENLVVKNAVAVPRKTLSLKATRIHDETSAARLACALADLYGSACWRHSWRSETAIEPGSIGMLSSPYSGMNGLVRVIERSFDPDSGIYSYKAVSIRPVTITPTASYTTAALGSPHTADEDPRVQAPRSTVRTITSLNDPGKFIDEVAIYGSTLYRWTALGWVDTGDTTPPTVPGIPSVFQLSAGSLRINFTGSTDTESGVALYRIYRRKQDASSWAAVLGIKHDGRTSTYQADDTSTIPGETYEYAVSAVDRLGNASALTAQSTAITAEITDPTFSNALIIDHALRRAALEAAFLDEHDSAIAGLAQETIDRAEAISGEAAARAAAVTQEAAARIAAVTQEASDRVAAVLAVQYQIDTTKPRITTIEELAAWAEDLLTESDNQFLVHEQSIKLVATDLDGATQRIGVLEIDAGQIRASVAALSPEVAKIAQLIIDVDSVESTVSSMAPNVAKISQIEQTVNSISSTVADYGTTKTRVSQVEQDVDSVTATVADYGTTKGRVSTLELGLDGLEVTVADLFGEVWQASKAYALGTKIHENGNSYEATTAGTSGTTEPTWPGSGTVSDGTVVWTYRGQYIADLSLLSVLDNRISTIVADGGIWVDGVFTPTAGYALADQTADAFSAFIGDAASLASWSLQFATKEEITNVVFDADLIPITNRLTAAEADIAAVPGQITTATTPLGARLTTTEAGLAAVPGQITTALAPYDTAVQAAGKYLAQATFSTFQQTQNAINLNVDKLYSGEAPPQRSDREAYLAWLDEAYVAASSGIVVNEQRIRLEVQDRETMGQTLTAAIQVEADRITAEVSRAIGEESALGTLITQTADDIKLAVWGAGGQEVDIYSLLNLERERINLAVFGHPADPIEHENNILGQLVVQAGGVAAMVEGGGTGGFLSLSVTLPAMITAAQYSSMVGPATEAEVAAVYRITDVGFYVVRPAVTATQIKTLKDKLRAAGKLGSQFLLESDQILLAGEATLAGALTVDGRFKATSIETEAIVSNALRVLEPGGFDAKIDKDGIMICHGSNTILYVDPATGASKFYGAIDVDTLQVKHLNGADGSFKGTLMAKSVTISDVEGGTQYINDVLFPKFAQASVTGESRYCKGYAPNTGFQKGFFDYISMASGTVIFNLGTFSSGSRSLLTWAGWAVYRTRAGNKEKIADFPYGTYTIRVLQTGPHTIEPGDLFEFYVYASATGWTINNYIEVRTSTNVISPLLRPYFVDE